MFKPETIAQYIIRESKGVFDPYRLDLISRYAVLNYNYNAARCKHMADIEVLRLMNLWVADRVR